MCTKIKVEGEHATIVSRIIAKAMRDSGLKVNYWTNVTPSEIPACRREATRTDSDVSLVAMTR
jgi:hypothetical protein